MRIRTLAALSVLAGLASIAVTAASEAAPTIGTSKVAPSSPADRPQVTVDPKSLPHIHAARTRFGDDNLPLAIAGGAAVPYEVSIKNPTNADARVTIDQDNTGGYIVTVPANSIKTFGVAHAIGLAPCSDGPIRSVWLHENEAVKLKIKVEPNCLLKATGPAMSVVQPAPGKIMYSNVKIKTAPQKCSDQLIVEANVTNGTNSAVNARLTFAALGGMNEFALAAGQTKAVPVGASMAGKSDGLKRLTLLDRGTPENPAFVEGSWAVDIASTCRPSITVVQ